MQPPNTSSTQPNGTLTPTVNGTTSSLNPTTSSSQTAQPDTPSTTNAAGPSNTSTSASNQVTPAITPASAPSAPPPTASESISAPVPAPPPKPKMKTPTKRGGPVHAYDAHHSLFLTSVYNSAPRPRQTRATGTPGMPQPLTGGSGSTSGRAGSVGKGKEKEKDKEKAKDKDKGKDKDKEKGKNKEKESSAPPRGDAARTQQKSSKSGEASSSARAAASTPDPHGSTSNGMDVDMSSHPPPQHHTTMAALKEEQDVINAKALELLVNLVDAKEALRKQILLEERAASPVAAPPAPSPPTAPVAPAAPPTDQPPALPVSGDVPMADVVPTPPPPSVADALAKAEAEAKALLAQEEKRALESKFHDFEGRFSSVKEELMGILGRLQSLEKETREQRAKEEEERRTRVLALEERLRIKEEEERQEKEFRRKREEEDRELERERRRLAEEEEKERVRKKREEEEAREREERERVEKERLRREAMKSVEVECRPVVEEMATQTEAEIPRIFSDMAVQHEEVEADVEMGEPTAFFAECAIQTDLVIGETYEAPAEEGEIEESAPRRILPFPQGVVEVVDQGVQVQTEIVVASRPPSPEVEIVPPAPPAPVREMAEMEIQTDPLPTLEAETTGTKEEATPTPTTASKNLLVDTQMQVDGIPSAGSETDVDGTATTATAVNGVPSPLQDAAVAAGPGDVIDPRTKVMSSNLSLLVDNLVSAKMLSVMDSMLKARTAATKPATPDATSQEQVEQADQSTSPVTEGAESTPGPGLSETHGSILMATLLDELKAMKEEARLRSQREKEEMEAIRQLHSAEVDALRRRLSYLESQNRFFEAGGVVMRERSTSVVAKGSNGHGTLTPTRTRNHSIGPMDGVESTAEGGAKTNPTPTPTSERTYSFTREGGEGDNMPLPSIKSQRKHHIAFPRAPFG
ncbi:hypothetical protein CVT26_005601 [Gymnopilus dilepis]|uniref:Uncharacterized protein n=1 Tax=Gymnopilus dilepis TaxID=231916 RepID=A0A409XZL7_9AGAR|nr:hypothetical protein CVT26_005601 [Gymnopilus dilepis]